MRKIIFLFIFFLISSTANATEIFLDNNLLTLKDNDVIVSFQFNELNKKYFIDEINQGLNENTYISDYYNINNKIYKYEIFYEDNICLVLYEFYDELDGKEIILRNCKDIILKIKDMI